VAYRKTVTAFAEWQVLVYLFIEFGGIVLVIAVIIGGSVAPPALI
jgi:hypothetical protein